MIFNKKWLFRNWTFFWLKMTIFDSKWVIWNDLFCKYAHFQGIKGRQPSNRFWKWFLKFLEKSLPTENEKCIIRVYFRVQIHYWCTALMWKIVKIPIADWLPYPPPLYINIGFGLSKKFLQKLHKKSKKKKIREIVYNNWNIEILSPRSENCHQNILAV